MGKKGKIFFSISAILIFSIFFSLYIYLKKRGDAAALKAAAYISMKTGRKTEIASASYSIMDGLVLKNAAIKEKDGKTDFFRFERAEIKLNEKELIKGNLLFEKAEFYNGRMRIVKEGPSWNFKDLIDLMPASKKPAHLLWNAKTLDFNNFDFYIAFDPSKSEFSASGADFSIEHRSSLGGNFSAHLGGSFAGLIEGKLISFKMKSAADVVFDYAKAGSAKADIVLENISYDQISASRAALNGEFFRLENSSGKSFKVNFSLKDLFIPASDSSAIEIFSILDKLQRAMGKNISSHKEVSVESLNLQANSKNGLAELNFSVSSNILSLELKSNSSLNPKQDKIKASIEAGDFKLSIDAESDFSKIHLKQDLSETSSKAVKELILKFEKDLLLKFFFEEEL